jgi:hypothetical protein
VNVLHYKYEAEKGLSEDRTTGKLWSIWD